MNLLGSRPTTLGHLAAAPGYWYLATPYSRYPGGLEAAFREACRITGELVRQRIGVFSPIAHSHPIAREAGIDPGDHAVWLPADTPLMASAHGLIVATMAGWHQSYGVIEEFRTFRAAAKPIVYLDPAAMAVREAAAT